MGSRKQWTREQLLAVSPSDGLNQWLADPTTHATEQALVVAALAEQLRALPEGGEVLPIWISLLHQKTLEPAPQLDRLGAQLLVALRDPVARAWAQAIADHVRDQPSLARTLALLEQTFQFAGLTEALRAH